ncbi:MAG TPA: glycosyl hydrolase, partial [Gemmatimonadaceae bacterium]
MARHPLRLLASAALLALGAAPVHRASAQPAGASFDELRWRMIGPHRAGRTKAAAGVPDQPNVFYVGVVNGGVWKTTDYGRTWHPIFDAMPTGSVGAIAIAPGDANRIYVGSGEGLQRPDLSTGDGIYRSDDAGRTWTHLGLRDGQQIPQIVVDPRDPDRLFVAVLGHPYGPNAERGVFRSTDGGRTFRKVLYRDENTGAVDIVLAPDDPNTVYAVLWEARQGPWENASWYGPGSGVYKSTDGGDTWQPINTGLPTFADGLGRIGITVAPSDARRLYATVEVRGTGWVYRSDDAGAHWYRASDDTRAASRPSDFAEIKVDPRDPDVVYTGSVVSWKSTDGGKTWTAFRGAPGGDDYHRLWINPKHPEIILLAADQGAIVTVNGGQTWSSWYNQPTAQLYHVTTDNAFPYRVCGGQQESGSVCIQSRGDYGAITLREWTPVGTEEYGYVAPDPLDPDIVYGGKVTRWSRDTRQVQDVGPKPLRGGDYRTVRTAPLVFSTVNPRALYFGSNVVWRTTDGGTHWTQISPDLTRTDSVLPPTVGVYAATPGTAGRHPGVVYTIAPSYVSDSVVWAGTDDGLIHVTFDGGKSWRDVTPPALRAAPWSKISIMDAGRHDARTAYAAVNTFRLDDLRPHIWRTHDGGATWAEIVAGIDSGAVVNVVREDPVRRGLLYAGSETQVWVSFDDGDHWRSLRLNMPATSIRDLVVKDQDLVVGTHGRSFWILDDVSPLRQWTDGLTSSDVALVRPATATRWRWNVNTDTPVPPDEPAGENPPDGAIVDYWLRAASATPVTLEVLDARQRLVRRYSSADTAMAPADVGNVPAYWIRPTRVLSAAAGLHRFVWDLRWSPPETAGGGSYPIAAIEEDTPREPRGPWVAPGSYTLRLTAGGRTVTQPITVRMDPRVTTSPADLQRQEAVSLELRDLMGATLDAQ